ncbi:MAG: RteC domain-containing protein [Dysgonomonas mossii]|uniref:RteC domain-containing protein n=1 Tax=Dysgonomonas mossii TaxID=163665 RepID=UPI00399119DE
MEKYISSLEYEIFQSIQEVEKMGCSMLQKSKLMVPQLEKMFEELKSFISNYTFKDTSEEIYFFKEIKPRLFSQLLYYSKVYSIEIRIPMGSMEDIKMYLMRILNRIKDFFDMNIDFYQYHRSGSTHLDHIYFLRRKSDIQLPHESFYFERDSRFSTYCDLRMAEILTNEMLVNYLNGKISRLTHLIDYNESTQNFRSTEKWTDKKNALGELIYGLDSLGSVNHGNIDIKVLADMFGKMFNVDLSNIYQIYLEIRARKGNRTEYLDRMITALHKRMDDDDNK